MGRGAALKEGGAREAEDLGGEEPRRRGAHAGVARGAVRAGLYAGDELTDRSERFMAAEFIREKLFRLLGEELPYAVSVVIEKFEQEGRLRRIFAAVIVDKANQKGIVLGEGGEKMKRIATEARLDLEKLYGGKVYLEVFVKVKSGWADDERVLRSLGYD